MKLKDNKGITGVEVAISITILIAFSSLIAGLFYNLAVTSRKINRKTQATEMAIQVIEAMKVAEFTNLPVTGEEPDNFQDIANLGGIVNINVPNGYNVQYGISGYNNDVDVVKIIKVQVEYPNGKDRTERIEIKTLIKNI